MRRWFVVVLLLILPLQAYSSHYHATVQGGQNALFVQHESSAEPVERSLTPGPHPLQQLRAVLAQTPMQLYADHADTPLPCPVQSFWLHAWPAACPPYSLPAICCEFAPEHRPPRV